MCSFLLFGLFLSGTQWFVAAVSLPPSDDAGAVPAGPSADVPAAAKRRGWSSDFRRRLRHLQGTGDSSNFSETPSNPTADTPSEYPTTMTTMPSNTGTAPPTTQTPSNKPSMEPTWEPSTHPSSQPSMEPTRVPSMRPSSGPSISMMPSISMQPSVHPSVSQAPSVSTAPSSVPMMNFDQRDYGTGGFLPWLIVLLGLAYCSSKFCGSSSDDDESEGGSVTSQRGLSYNPTRRQRDLSYNSTRQWDLSYHPRVVEAAPEPVRYVGHPGITNHLGQPGAIIREY